MIFSEYHPGVDNSQTSHRMKGSVGRWFHLLCWRFWNHHQVLQKEVGWWWGTSPRDLKHIWYPGRPVVETSTVFRIIMWLLTYKYVLEQGKKKLTLSLYSDLMILQFKIDGLVVGGIVISFVMVGFEERGIVSPTSFTITLYSRALCLLSK